MDNNRLRNVVFWCYLFKNFSASFSFDREFIESKITCCDVDWLKDTISRTSNMLKGGFRYYINYFSFKTDFRFMDFLTENNVSVLNSLSNREDDETPKRLQNLAFWAFIESEILSSPPSSYRNRVFCSSSNSSSSTRRESEGMEKIRYKETLEEGASLNLYKNALFCTRSNCVILINDKRMFHIEHDSPLCDFILKYCILNRAEDKNTILDVFENVYTHCKKNRHFISMCFFSLQECSVFLIDGIRHYPNPRKRFTPVNDTPVSYTHLDVYKRQI